MRHSVRSFGIFFIISGMNVNCVCSLVISKFNSVSVYYRTAHNIICHTSLATTTLFIMLHIKYLNTKKIYNKSNTKKRNCNLQPKKNLIKLIAFVSVFYIFISHIKTRDKLKTHSPIKIFFCFWCYIFNIFS